MSTVLVFIIGVLILGILVFVHEFGHFIMAKINKIGVDAFSIGFGKEIFGFTIGETRYRISMIPFGGYCKMRGEETKDREEGKGEDPRAMYNRPPYARLLAVLGGPLFNYLFAILVMSIILLIGYKDTLRVPQVWVLEKDAQTNTTPAYLSGLRTGDTILNIDGKEIESYDHIVGSIALKRDEALPIVYLHEGKTNRSKIIPRFDKSRGWAYVGVGPLFYPKIGYVETNTPAETAGLKAGDVLLSIDGKKIQYFYEIEGLIQDKTNQNVSLEVVRGNATNLMTAKISRFEGKGYLGIIPGDWSLPKYDKIYRSTNWVMAFHDGFFAANAFIGDSISGLVALIKQKIDFQKTMSGPIGIAKVAGEVALQADAGKLFRFIAFLSAALGFFNLIPFPGLDGGHVVFNTIELVTRRRFPERVRSYIEYVGLLCILLLTFFVVFNDIFNIIKGRL